MKRYRTNVLAIASISAGLLAAAPARAGTFSKVEQSVWQEGVTGLPTYVNMYLYLPTTPASKPPIVVFPHQCTGTANGSHGAQGGLEKIADTSGFIIIYPEATGQNCWDAGSSRSLKHGGGGDTGAVAQMVKYTVGKHNADPNRVYVTGPSSGGIMTEALLGVYPDVFMGGISMMGVPCGCWAEGYNDVIGKPANGTGQWSGPCAGGNVTKTAQQWGDLVRSYFPEYGKKHRPRLQHWHGATDSTLSYKNVAEDIKEWTNVLGLSEAPTGTEQNTPKSGTTRQYWKNDCFTVYETFVLANTGHSVMVDANTIAKYFGLDKPDSPDPETAACPGAVPGGGGSSPGTGGTSGSGGGTGTGAGGAGGERDGGLGGRDGGGRDTGTAGSGGGPATGGSPGSGGAQASGGRSGNGGAQASGGVVGSGGTGASGSGGVVGSGGSAVGTGGSAGSGGEGQGGKQAHGGSTTPSGSSGGSTTAASSDGSGCAVGGHAGHSASTLAVLLLAAGALIVHRRRRIRR